MSAFWARLTVGLSIASCLPGRILAKVPHPIIGVQTGIDPATGQVPVRRDITAFSASKDEQWDLYVQSLKALYETDWHDSLSYYQIAGIHGLPYGPWDDDQDKIYNPNSGYCPHGLSTFFPWHRPYLMLFEESLVKQAISIANTYPPRFRDLYVEAAQTLRLPYWDWALNSDVPPVVSTPTLTIKVPPTGSQIPKTGGPASLVEQTVPNPLFNYTFPKVTSQRTTTSIPDASLQAIQRCADPGELFPDKANRALRDANIQDQMKSFLFVENSLQSYGSWTSELEGIHNIIHSVATCGDTLAWVNIAAFEPLFWLHHVNIDRLSAIIQAINPEASMLAGSFRMPSRSGLLTTQGRTLVDAGSPLRPFWLSDTARHTSKSINDIQGLGYAYEGLEYWKLNASDVRSSAIRLVRNLYSKNFAVTRRYSNSGKLLSRRSAPKRTLGARSAETTHMSYILRISLERAEVQTPCVITAWIGDQTAGSAALLAMPESGIANMRVPLTTAIQQSKIQAPGLNTTIIQDPIIQHLKLGISTAKGVSIPVESVPSLQLTLETVKMSVPASADELPWFEESSLKSIDVSYAT